MSAFIESGKLRNPIQTSQIIFELGLDTVRDIQELSASEMMELQAAFEHAGLLLGDRSKIRRLAAAHKSPDEHADNISSPQAHTPAAEQTARVDRRRSQEQSVAESTAETVRSVELLSEELVAIVAMGVLALISYMVQTTAGRNAARETADADRAQLKEEAKIERSLARISLQMSTCLRPIQGQLLALENTIFHLGHELGLDSYHWSCGVEDSFTFVTLQPQQDHIEVMARKFSPGSLSFIKQRPYHKYSPEDMQKLAEDPEKRQRFVDEYTHVVVPQYRQIAEMIRTTSHLLELPAGVEKLQEIYSDIDVPWVDICGNTCIFPIWDFVAFACEWAPITAHWAAGRYERLQPRMVNPANIVILLLTGMKVIIGQRELALVDHSTGASASAQAAHWAREESRGKSKSSVGEALLRFGADDEPLERTRIKVVDADARREQET